MVWLFDFDEALPQTPPGAKLPPVSWQRPLNKKKPEPSSGFGVWLCRECLIPLGVNSLIRVHGCSNYVWYGKSGTLLPYLHRSPLRAFLDSCVTRVKGRVQTHEVGPCGVWGRAPHTQSKQSNNKIKISAMFTKLWTKICSIFGWTRTFVWCII